MGPLGFFSEEAELALANKTIVLEEGASGSSVRLAWRERGRHPLASTSLQSS